MSRLIWAGIRRYTHGPILWIGAAASLIFGLLIGEMQTKSNMLDSAVVIYPQLIFACIISLSLGRETADGAVRNKIIAGHGKGQIILSEIILAVCACLFLTVLYSVPVFAISTKTFEDVPMDVGMTVMIGLLLVCVASAVINVLVCMFIRNRALTAIVCLLLVAGLGIVADEMHLKLDQPEYIRIHEFVYDEKTGAMDVVINDDEPNPNYISGNKRRLYTFLVNIIPFGHAEEYADIVTDYIHNDLPLSEDQNTSLDTNIFYMLGVITVLTFAGMFFYRRRDMK